MPKRKIVFWEVDAQQDFMLPGGKLYVPGAEKLIPHINRLVGAAREGRVFLVSSGCQHVVDDPEFQQFPPHCIRGTPGAQIISAGLAERRFRIPNDPAFHLPDNLLFNQQVVLEKQVLDVFSNPHADTLVERLGRDAEYFVFGVVTEYCVRLAAKGLLERGRRVSIVKDAIETLKPGDGQRTLEELKGLGAQLITSEEALMAIPPGAAHRKFP